MPQIFHPSTNTIAKVSLAAALLAVVGAILLMQWYVRSDYSTGVGDAVNQPVQFPHQHHVAGLGIDCRYCHYNVEESAYAVVPPTQTCMNCHSQIWSDSPYLEPVRASWRTGKSIEWNRVHNLPQHVYFNHSIHVKKGVACETCHGPVGDMPLTWKAESMLMEWCLSCHRNPEKYIGPVRSVVSSAFAVPNPTGVLEPDRVSVAGNKGVAVPKDAYHINGIIQCSTCHR